MKSLILSGILLISGAVFAESAQKIFLIGAVLNEVTTETYVEAVGKGLQVQCNKKVEEIRLDRLKKVASVDAHSVVNVTGSLDITRIELSNKANGNNSGLGDAVCKVTIDVHTY